MVEASYLLDSIAAGIGFLIYTAANFWQSLRVEGTKGRSERWSKHKVRRPKKESRTVLHYVHLLGDLVVFALSITYAILLAKSRRDRLAMKADHDVSAILFGSLLWLVFFLGLTDQTKPASYEQFVPWMILSVSYAVSCAINTADISSSSEVVAVQWLRLLVVFGLIAATLIERLGLCGKRQREEIESEETQPLIAANGEPQEAAENQAAEQEAEVDDDDDDDDDRSVKSFASDEDEEAEQKEDENDAQKEEKKQQKALRDRPWYQYLASFAIFIPYVKPHGAKQYMYVTIMVLQTLAARAVTVGQPLMLGAVVDDLTRQRFVLWRLLAYVGLRFASSSSGIALIRNLASYRLNLELHNILLIRCFNHIMDLDATYHMSKNTPATWQIMERGQSVINLLQDIFFNYIPVIADLVLALFVVSHLFGAYLCFAVTTTMVLLSWSNRISISLKTAMRRSHIDLWRNWYFHMTESFQFWRTVSEFNKIEHEKGRHLEKTKAYQKVSLKQQTFRNYLSALQQVVITVGFLFVCIIAAMEIVAGRLDVGRFVVLITYWGQVMGPVSSVTGFTSDIAEQLVDAEKLLLLLEKQPRVTSKPNAPAFEFKGGHVKFEKCDFSYDGQRVVTKNVSFEALPGSTTAIVGETGGGKSTIFNLLYRFYDPSSGTIHVDGQDISQVELNSYRSILGLVPQDTILFNTSIIKNIRYGDLKATKAEVVEASKAAQFHDKVMKFPKKYKQKVGELAQKLSGGEKQRLAIARAILKKPGILLLDEATSAVDSVTETKIQASLEKLSEGRTTFVIAHRLSTIMGADTILVVKNGEIVEAGSHQDLLDSGNGAYKELWEAQLKLSTGKPKKNKEAKSETDADDLIDLVEGEGDTASDGTAVDKLDTATASPSPEKADESGQDVDEHEDKSASLKSLGVASQDLLTPSASNEVSSRTVSVQDSDNSEQVTSTGVNHASETSSVKSTKSNKSRNYGTV